MLSTLRIRHIGVIDDALLEFGPGFTALTGETGAGKTMVVTGLSLLLGGRLDSRRAGAASTVDGTLVLEGHETLAAELDELGAEEDDGEVLIVRRTTRDGRSRAQIGGVPVPIGTLARLVGSAVTVHGQSDQQRLRDPDPQREALDSYAGAPVADLVAAHRELWSVRETLHAEQRRLAALLDERDRRGEALTSALERLEALDSRPGEDDELRAELDRLAHAVDLRADAERGSLALVGDDAPSAVSLVDIAAEAVRAASRTDPELEGLAERLDAARLDLSDIAADLGRYADGIDASPGRLDAANERLHELTVAVRDLAPVLGPATDVAGLLEASRTAAADLDRFEGAHERLATVEHELAELEPRLEHIATELTAARTAAADRLADAVQRELAHLEMPGASLRVEVVPATPRAHGRDGVRILLAPHPGAEHMPVATAASGGELSRVMLALEVALASSRDDELAAPVFVFDEIDAGIGGRAALAVGQRLARLARHAQVIVVTHLPQVAAHASTHLRIVKEADDGTTTSTVEALDRAGRVRELARMLAGDDASEVARAHAEELLADATAGAAR
ncbi:DNA repair protein RecN [Brachybacterium huguangmaarense]|uniref:DNA repair protein RecN n=1 Tax=Brachybacterium huguangmaarense TaxID=1652028 RepID=A0ABY6G1K2_9MICO|nr:DNA repair protein RecN [Brachybacterium huguangmaarense]UYG16558.1 DNA repair protein RecN [Brachybacterium huguangmaarense]